MRYHPSAMPDPTAALYVRLPHPEFDKLDRAAEALATNKKTLVTTLVSHYVDPDSDAGPRPSAPTSPGMPLPGGGDQKFTIPAGPTDAVGDHHLHAAPRRPTC